MRRNVHWNTERQELGDKDDVFGIVEKQHGQWVPEYGPTRGSTAKAFGRNMPKVEALAEIAQPTDGS